MRRVRGLSPICFFLFLPHELTAWSDIPMTLDGVEIITNSSASHFSLQKLDIRLKLIGEATRQCGGVYVYSNVQGTLSSLEYGFAAI